MSDMFPSGWWIPTAIICGLLLLAFGGICIAIGYWIGGV